MIDGVDRLRDGAKVEVIAADPKQRAGANAPPGGGRRGPAGAASGAGAASAAMGDDGASRPQRRASAPLDATASAAPPAAVADAGSERPPWLDRLPPDVAEKVIKMSPDERREWIRKRREERAQREGQ